jgi:hypothetical protein
MLSNLEWGHNRGNQGNAQQFPREYEGCPLEKPSSPYLVDSAESLRYPNHHVNLTKLKDVI